MSPPPRRGAVWTVALVAIALLAVLPFLDRPDAERLLVGGLVATLGMALGRAWERAQHAPAQRAALEPAVLDAATEVAILATDLEGKVELFNSGAERLVGRSRAETLGREAWVDWIDAEEIASRRAELAEACGHEVSALETLFALSTRGASRAWTLVRPNGERRPICLVTTTRTDDTGRVCGHVSVALDATVRAASESALREAIEAAQRANEAKTRFLANTSHEIRTPMNAVLGLVYLLAHTRLDAEQRELVTKIDTASKSLLGLLSDILDLGKLEADELILEHTPFDLHRVVRERTGIHLAEASAKGVSLEVRIDPRVATAVEGDPGRVGQIVTNLVSNAVKFTESGRVIVELREAAHRDPDSAREVALEIEVRDSGIGMTPEVMAELFKPFAQADASTTRRHGGTGLGLTIVQRLVHLMGGEIHVDSEPELGTEIRVTLRLDRCAVPVASEPVVDVTLPAGKALTGLAILVADDSETNRVVAEHVLRLHGADVHLAENGLEAVELLRQGSPIDAVLMDVHMPVIDGPEATFVTRTELGLGPDVLPIIALTAGTLSSERERALGSGMNDFLTKPIVPDTLVATLLRHSRRVGAARPASAPEAEIPTPPERASVREIEGIDWRDLSARLGNDPALALTLLEHFREETFGLTWPMGELDAGALEAHRATMHRLKGSAATVGAVDVAARAAAIEVACKAGDASSVRTLGAELRARLEALREAIARAREPGPTDALASRPAA